MTPLHVWALLAGAAGLALPVLIHLLTRPRGERRALPAFRFLVESANYSAHRNRLRTFLILACRIAAVACIALAFARFVPRENKAASGANGRARKIVVLDCSLSMRAVASGVALFDVARLRAQQALEDQALSEADVVFAAHTAHAVFGRPSANLAALRDEIAKARALPQALDTAAMLDCASRTLAGLAEQDLKHCTLLVVTDLQRSNWASAGFARVPKDVAIQFLNVRAEQPGQSNVAVLKAGISGLPEAGAPFAVRAELANFSDIQTAVEAELVFDGRSWKQKAALKPRGTQTVVFELKDVQPGWRHGLVRITPAPDFEDALADDNSFPLCVNVRSARQIALLTAEPAGDAGGPAYLLEQGLLASPDATVKVARYSPARLEGELEDALWRSDLLAIVNCGRLSDGQAAGVGRLLTAGLPVLYVTQFNADADNLKALRAALGPALRLPLEFLPYRGAASQDGAAASLLSARGDGKRAAGDRFLVSVNVERRPFKVFGDALSRLTQSLRLSGGLASATVAAPAAESDPVLARYSDGSAALLLTRVAAGKLCLLNMAVGGEGRHLAAHPTFVPLLQELCLELLGGDAELGAQMVTAGCSFSLMIPHWLAREGSPSPPREGVGGGDWRLARAGGGLLPADTSDAPVFRTDTSGTTLYWSAAGEPGVYLVQHGGQTVSAFSVQPPTQEESDLTALDSAVLTGRLAGDRTLNVLGRAESERLADQGRERFDYFFLAALGLLLTELVLLKVFRT